MLWCVIAILITIIVMVFLRFKWPVVYEDRKKMPLLILVLVVSILASYGLGIVITTMYYQYGDPYIELVEVQLHYSGDNITTEDYINKNIVTVMDRDYNVIKIDLAKTEVEFVSTQTQLIKHILTPKGYWKYLVVFSEKEYYTVQIRDWLLS